MKEFDLGDFLNFMKNILEIYDKQLNMSILKIWFDDLIEFELSQIKFAFEVYRKKPKGEYFPKTAAPIISIIREMKSFQEKKVESFRTRKCSRIGCRKSGDEPFAFEEKVYWVCRDHAEELILDAFPDSANATRIALSRKHEDYARQAGMTQHEWAQETGVVRKLEELRKGVASNPTDDRPKTIFEFESSRESVNASKNDYSLPRMNDLDLGNTSGWV